MSIKTQSFLRLHFIAICVIGICNPALIAQDQDSVSVAMIAPTADMPLFKLHSPKLGTNRDGERTLEFTYSQTRPGRTILTDTVIRLGNSNLGQKMIFGGIAYSEAPSTYRIRLSSERLKQVESEGIEIFFIGELTSSTGELGNRQTHKHTFKLSNSIFLGSAREQATTRQPDLNENNAVTQWLEGLKRQDQLDANIPKGFARKLSTMVPGMTICVFINNEWKQAEYLGEDEDRMVIYRPDANKRETAVIDSSLVVRKLADLDHFNNPAMRSKPIPFKASLNLMSDSSVIIPDGYEILSHSFYIPGMPVKVRVKNELVDGYVVSTKYAEATVRFMGLDFWKKPVEKNEVVSGKKLLVAKSDLAILNTPDGKAGLEANLTKRLTVPEHWQKSDESTSGSVALNSGFKGLEMQSSGSSAPIAKSNEASLGPAASERKVKRYPIQLAVPRGMRIVSPEHPLQPGTKLGCNWGSTWYPVTVLQLYDDGAVRIHWDNFSTGFDADQLREDLIISDQILKKLQRTANSPNASPREWADASGKFKVVARFVKLDAESVVFQKANQETIRVRLDKLSEKDQEIIKQISGLSEKNK